MCQINRCDEWSLGYSFNPDAMDKRSYKENEENSEECKDHD